MPTRAERTAEGYPISYDEYAGVTVDLPKICPFGCGMNIEGYYDMHIVFHHPELRSQPKSAEKTKKGRRKK